MQPVQNVEIIEIETINGKGIYKFPTQPYFRDHKVKAVEAWSVTETPVSPLGANVINANAFKTGFLTLNVGGKEKIKDIPLSALCDTNNYKLKFEVNSLEIDIDKSLIKIDPAQIVAGEVILLGVYFDDKQ